MSLQFSNSTNKSGIVELIDAYVKTNSSRYPLTEKTRDINLALDRVFSLIFKNSGDWQFDDSNHSDYPIITTNLVANQRDYSFVSDETGNLVLDIYKVMVKTSATGSYAEIKPVDQQSDADMSSFFDGNNATGIPTRYDKTANGIFLDVIPSYSATDGLKIFINREASYFTTTDTTKKPGFAGIFHEYLALRPAYQYALRNGLPNVNILKAEMLEMEQAIEQYYANRERDVTVRMKPNVENAR